MLFSSGFVPLCLSVFFFKSLHSRAGLEKAFCVFVIQMKWRRRKWRSGESSTFDLLECLPLPLPPARRRFFFLCVCVLYEMLWPVIRFGFTGAMCLDSGAQSAVGNYNSAERRPFGRGVKGL